jgi:2-haloacid dehalogenase
MLDLKPSEVLMVAAHNGDLRAAKAQGLSTAFVPRLTEHGPHQQVDVVPDQSCVDIVAESFTALAGKLGC